MNNINEVVSLQKVQIILEEAWNRVVPIGSISKPLKTLKVTDWDILETEITFLFNSDDFAKYNLPTFTGESFHNLYLKGAGKKNRALFSVCLYLLIKRNELKDKEDYLRLEDFDSHRFYFLNKLEKNIQLFQVVDDNKNNCEIDNEDIIPKFVESNPQLVENLNIDSSQSIKNILKYKYNLTTIAIILTTALFVYFTVMRVRNDKALRAIPNDPRIKFSVSSFTNKKIAPTDISFQYDLSKVKYDSAFVEFGDLKNPIKYRLKNPVGIISNTFTESQGRQVCILVDTVKKFLFVPICSDGWYSKLDEFYFPKSKMIRNGILHIPLEEIPHQIIKNGEFYVALQNLSEFNFDTDNIIFETRVKNPHEEGGISCFDISIDLNGLVNNKLGILSFNIVKPKCTRFAHIRVGDSIYPQGESKVILDKLGIDFNEWSVIKVITQNNRFKIFVNNNELYDFPYVGKIGKLLFMQIYFKGTGSVDWVKMSNLKGKVLYNENFN